jgi:hypothetical protein
MLTMHDSQANVAVGKWVRVCKGTYKGDMGYISAIKDWGGVSLLLVPHLPPPCLLGKSPSKRKHSRTPPEPELFDPNVVRRTYSWDPVPFDQTNGHYLCNNIVFEHGLIVKTFDLHSILLTSVYIPTNLFFLLQHSHHPCLLASTFPQPAEWIFEEGKQVVIFSSAKQGIIKTVGVNVVEVELGNGEGVVRISWSDLHK